MDRIGRRLGKKIAALEHVGLAHAGLVHYQYSPAHLVEDSLARGEGSSLSHTGALRVSTGERTGRSPEDRFIVRDELTASTVDWGKVNKPMEPGDFDRLLLRVTAYLENRELYVFDGFAGADPAHRLSLRVVSELAWHSLFANQLFIRPTLEELAAHDPEFTVLFAPGFHTVPGVDPTRSNAAIVLNMGRKFAVICGTAYAGECKKAIFTVMNFLLPGQGVFPMHCSANLDPATGETALFFGLSGTGKTTLSADPHRGLIGDDEHGWSPDGIFNFEGGCYAKCVNLTEEREPDIYRAIKFGAIMENVVVDEDSRIPDYEDISITENTRVGYPLDFINNAVLPSVGRHPSAVLFLTCDAFGVLPPISRLTREQAMYHFLSGYTAKLAGTEVGVTEPGATFSSCFGAPFLPLPAAEYAKLLGARIDAHHPEVFLVNTGWSGGPYGVGQRMSLRNTRALVLAALEGKLRQVEYEVDPYFGLAMPKTAPDVPCEILNPVNTWADKAAYEAKALHLVKLFRDNFAKFRDVPPEVLSGGPRV